MSQPLQKPAEEHQRLQTTPRIRRPPFLMCRDIEQVREVLRIYGAMEMHLMMSGILEDRKEIGNLMYAYDETSRQALVRAPPIVVRVPQGLLDQLAIAGGASGAYVPGTNIVLVSSSPLRFPDGTPQRVEDIITHETLHYLDYLLHANRIVFRSRGRLVNPEPPRFFDEGATNYAALQVVGGMHLPGNREAPASYAYPTAVMVAIEMLAGIERLAPAMQSGNWERVQQAIDQKLGQGTFERILECGNGAEAIGLILELDGGQPPLIDRQLLERHPVMRRARRGIEAMRPPSMAGQEI